MENKYITNKDGIPSPEDCDVSYEYGFLVAKPMDRLPEYFDPWNDVAFSLPELIHKKTVRHAVSQLPELDHSILTMREERLCAYTLLGFISHAYIWQEGSEGVTKVLPRQLAVPFYSISRGLGLPPVITYTSFALANWRFKHTGDENNNSGCLHTSNVQSLVCHYPRKASNWFMISSWFVEVKFIPAIKAIIEALHAVVEANIELLETHLKAIAEVIRTMKHALTQTHENLDAADFYQSVRPFLYGWGGTNSPLPDGLIYEGISPHPIKASGGSGAQSSTIHCLDAFLGIQHSKERKAYLHSVREYMPPKHRQFVEALERGPSVREFIKGSGDIHLQGTYDATVDALLDFRSYHIQLITKYIVIPSHKASTTVQTGQRNLGTGETTVLPFLKSIRNSTRDSKLDTP